MTMVERQDRIDTCDSQIKECLRLLEFWREEKSTALAAKTTEIRTGWKLDAGYNSLSVLRGVGDVGGCYYIIGISQNGIDSIGSADIALQGIATNECNGIKLVIG